MGENLDRFTRVKWLVGEDILSVINKLKVCVFGLGGVGGICVDALYRTGFKDFTLVDADSFEETNLNRQIHSENLGENKAEVFARIYGVNGVVARVSEDFLKDFNLSEFDLVIDAIDDIPAKIALAKAVKSTQIFISSTGGARKIDPTRIQIAPLNRTHGDALAKKFRYELKKAGGKGNFDVVFSDEKPLCKDLGSFMGVTASFGLALASLALQKVMKKYG